MKTPTTAGAARAIVRSALAVWIVLGAFSGAAAHHSAARFDFSKSATVAGLVKKIEVSNPHTHLVLEVTDDAGTRDIVFEGHSRNNAYRRGWRPGMVEAGDRVTITYRPTRDGSDGGYVTEVETAAGDRF